MIRDVQLVTQRKPLEDVIKNRLERWLVRKYFAWRGFACRSHVCKNEDGRHSNQKDQGLCNGKCYASIEYRGAFDDEADARWAANCKGGAYKPIPYNSPLPEETVTYKAGDVPQSEASAWYRKGVPMPFVAVRREHINVQMEGLKSLEGRLSDLSDCIEGKCAKAS